MNYPLLTVLITIIGGLISFLVGISIHISRSNGQKLDDLNLQLSEVVRSVVLQGKDIAALQARANELDKGFIRNDIEHGEFRRGISDLKAVTYAPIQR